MVNWQMKNTSRNLSAASQKLLPEYGCKPSNDVLSASMETYTTKASKLFVAMSLEPNSREMLPRENGYQSRDCIEDQSIPRPEEATGFSLIQKIRDLTNTLPDLEKKVIELRFGLNDGNSHTLKEVSRYTGITRELVRQIESKFFILMRNFNNNN